MRGLREHLTLLLATAVWSVLLSNRAALVGREAHEESSVLPAAQRTHTQQLMQVSLRRLHTKQATGHTHTRDPSIAYTHSLSLSHTGRRNPSYEYESPADLIIRQSPTRDR